jgi:hypothetical protein
MLPLLTLSVKAAIDPSARSFTLLSEARGNLTFIPYTAEQRQLVAKNIENLFSVFVYLDRFGSTENPRS